LAQFEQSRLGRVLLPLALTPVVARPCLGQGGGSGVIKFLPVPFYSRAL